MGSAGAGVCAVLMAQTRHPRVQVSPRIRGLHSSTFQLNLSCF